MVLMAERRKPAKEADQAVKLLMKTGSHSQVLKKRKKKKHKK